MAAAVADPAVVLSEQEQKVFDELDDSVADKRDVHGGLVYTNQEEIADQRRVCLEFLRQLGYNFLSGGDVANTSLPVKLFEARSFLERMTEFWSYSDLLVTAAKTTDPVERLQYVIAFAVAGLHRDLVDPKKPFNPVLGETYEGSYPDGASIFCEQTSHHPPISSFQILGPKNQYVLSGYMKLGAAMRGNSVRITHEGPHILHFSDGTEIKWDLPVFVLTGVFYGARVGNVVGKMTFVDDKNGLSAVVKFNPHEKGWIASMFSWTPPKSPSDYFEARIFKHEGPVVNPEKGEQVALGDGSWLDTVKFGDSVLWDIKCMVLHHARPGESPIPSDCRFREDLKSLAAGDYDEAQKAKVRVEEKQREEKRFRKGGKAQLLAQRSQKSPADS